jgi:hypothetical protein
MASQYAYAASGILAADPPADGVVVSFGVNDYLQGASVPAVQSSLLSIVDQIHVRQSAPILLVQTPRCPINGRTYDQYGAAMQAVAGARSGVIYVPTSEIWGALTWQADGAHLDANGKSILAAFVDEKLKWAAGIYKKGLRINGEDIVVSNILTSKMPMRINGLGIVSMPISIGIKAGGLTE